MKKIPSAFSLVLVVLLLLSSCLPTPEPRTVEPPAPEEPTDEPPAPEEPTAPPEESVGTINLVFAQVLAGPLGHLQNLDGVSEFYSGYGVRVTGGGKGKLDLNDGTRLILFNKTEITGVNVSVSPRRSDFFLKQEGLLGYIPPGGRTTVNLPNGAEITILGTTFLILYNQQTEVATAGNFDGTVLYTLPTGQQQELRAGNLVEIPARGEATLAEITFTPDEFEAEADVAGRPTAGLVVLLEKSQPPEPLAAPQIIRPTDYVNVDCPNKTGANVFLEWQPPAEPDRVSGYELALEVSGDNEFWSSYNNYQIEGGYSTTFDMSELITATFTCTDYGYDYYRWTLSAHDTAGNPGAWSDWAFFVVSNPVPVLGAPVQLSPANGSVFDFYPRTTTLEWSVVEGANSYVVEVDCYHCCEMDRWCTDVGQTWKVERGISTTTYTFDFVGAQPGRWRVWAVGPTGQDGPQSDWWEFNYTQ